MIPESCGFTATIVERNAGTRNVGIQRQALSSVRSFTTALRKKMTMMALRILNMATSHQMGAMVFCVSSLSPISISSILGFFLTAMLFWCFLSAEFLGRLIVFHGQTGQ